MSRLSLQIYTLPMVTGSLVEWWFPSNRKHGDNGKHQYVWDKMFKKELKMK